MSEEAQVEVIAKNKGVPTRTDLAENKYSEDDPRIVTINSLMAKGETPYAKNFNASFNDPQSPWLETVRGALFGDADKALSDGNTAITESLQQGS
jgi:multiple sugar transport system substrate-binding protein